MDEFYSLGFLLNRASVSLAKSLNSKLAKEKIDLPHSQFIVLRCLYFKDGISQLDIANLLSKDAAAIKRTIDNLEKKGFVRRQPVRNLKNNIYITQEGKSIMPAVIEIANGIIAKSLGDMDNERYKLLIEMLENIHINTEKE